MHQHANDRFYQRGAVLFMALIFLLIMTILGIFGMSMSRLENLMAGNVQFQTTALSDAELVLNNAEADLVATLAVGKEFNDSGDHYFDSSTDTPPESVDASSVDWTGFTYATPDGDPNNPNRYVIEYADCDVQYGNAADACAAPCGGTGCVHVYIMTAQSETSRGARRTVQSVFVSETGPAGP